MRGGSRRTASLCSAGSALVCRLTMITSAKSNPCSAALTLMDSQAGCCEVGTGGFSKSVGRQRLPRYPPGGLQPPEESHDLGPILVHRQNQQIPRPGPL